MEDMQVQGEDKSEEAALSFEKLKNIMEIYNNCPTFLRGDANNSDNLRHNMESKGELAGGVESKRADKLF